MSLAINRTAAQSPAPPVNSTFLYRTDFNVTSSIPTAVVAQTVIANATLWGAKFNQNAVLNDILASYGAGGMGIVHGLVISVPGSGLLLPITAGGGLIGGAVQLKTATTIACSNGDNFIWFKNDGTFERTATSTPPVLPSIFIGYATATAGNITAVDGAGVVYCYGGECYRETADVYMPTDTPPSNWRGLTKTAGGKYLWIGTVYEKIGVGAQVQIKTTNYSITANDTGKVFTNEGAGGNINFTLPAAAANLGPFTFYVRDANEVKITAAASCTLRLASSVSAAAGNVKNSTVGGVITIICINGAEWIAIYHEGTWVVT